MDLILLSIKNVLLLNFDETEFKKIFRLFVPASRQIGGLINLILIPDELDVSEPLEDVLLDSLAEEGSTGD